MNVRRNVSALAWLACIVIAVVYIAFRGIEFDTSILALLPKHEQDPLIARSAELSGQSAAVMTLVLSTPESSLDQMASASAMFYQSLIDSRVFSSVSRQGSDDNLALLLPYQSYKNFLLDDRSMSYIDAKKNTELADQFVNDLYQPLTLPRPLSFTEDSFNLFGRWLSGLRSPPKPLSDSHGIYVNAGGTHHRFIFVSVEGDSFDLQLQQAVLVALADAESELDESIRLRRSGLLFHAAAGAAQAKLELSTIGLGSILGVVLLLLLLFRHVIVLPIAALPLAVGCLIALAVTAFIFGRVHLVTLAFGASLVGVSVDYTLHYLCARYSASAVDAERLLPALFFGLVSSLVAYSSFSLTPFPGLQQMAIFAIAGLVAAWLTVVLWLPRLNVTSKPIDSRLFNMAGGVLCNSVKRNVVLVIGGCIIATLSITSLYKFEVSDDIRQLNTSPESMLVVERQVQQLLVTPATDKYLLISGKDVETILQREEELRVNLEELIFQGDLLSYVAISSLLPSLERQAKNNKAIENLMTQGWGQFSQKLALPANVIAEVNASYERSPSAPLTFEAWRQLSIAETFRPLQIMSNDQQRLEGSIVLLIGELDSVSLAKIVAMAERHEGVRFVNRVDLFSSLLADYRKQITRWLVVVYILLGLMLIMRYRKYGILVIATPALATLSAIGLLQILGQPITLFHMLAAVLVLGIGLDMGIFLRESRAAAHTVIAVSASAITTMLAFGLLALSNTPVLQFFGQMALLGISFSWLISFGLSIFYKGNGGIHGI